MVHSDIQKMLRENDVVDVEAEESYLGNLTSRETRPSTMDPDLLQEYKKCMDNPILLRIM